MRVRIWKGQADLFEITVLEQSAELVPCELDDLVTSDWSLPVVLVGRAFISGHEQKMRELAAALYRSHGTMLVVPPFGDSNVQRFLDIPATVRVVRRATESVVRPVHPEWKHLGSELTIKSDHVLDTSLAAGLVAVDRAGKAIVVRYQPRNTAGALFISTVQLLSYTALSTERDREALLTALLAWRGTGTESSAASTMRIEAHSPSHEVLVTTVLAMDTSARSDIPSLRFTAEHYLDLLLSVDQLRHTLEFLATQGVVAPIGGSDHIEVDKAKLHEVIEKLGLHAYARELREITRKPSEAST
jgi:hypothetical protein